MIKGYPHFRKPPFVWLIKPSKKWNIYSNENQSDFQHRNDLHGRSSCICSHDFTAESRVVFFARKGGVFCSERGTCPRGMTPRQPVNPSFQPGKDRTMGRGWDSWNFEPLKFNTAAILGSMMVYVYVSIYIVAIFFGVISSIPIHSPFTKQLFMVGIVPTDSTTTYGGWASEIRSEPPKGWLKP